MNFVSVIMLIFCILGGIDRMLGNRFGLGKEFEKGFMLLGSMSLTMVGMICLSPLIADLLAPCFDWVYSVLHLDPSIIPAAVFANDMGGAPLSKEIARNEQIGMFNALVVSSMMGATISYSIPFGLGIVKKEHHKELFFGILCGIVTIPVGCLVAGVIWSIPFIALCINLLPLITLSAVIACGLVFLPEITVRIFSVLGVLMKILITIGLLLGIFQFMTGMELIKGLADISEGADICFNAAIVLSGAFPLMHIVSKILSKPIQRLGKLLSISPKGAMGLVSTLITNSTTFDMLNGMEQKGIVLNSAFLVSGAFVFGSHLAFTMAFDADWLIPVIVAKLISGLSALVLALLLYRRVYREKEIKQPVGSGE